MKPSPVVPELLRMGSFTDLTRSSSNGNGSSSSSPAENGYAPTPPQQPPPMGSSCQATTHLAARLRPACRREVRAKTQSGRCWDAAKVLSREMHAEFFRTSADHWVSTLPRSQSYDSAGDSQHPSQPYTALAMLMLAAAVTPRDP